MMFDDFRATPKSCGPKSFDPKSFDLKSCRYGSRRSPGRPWTWRCGGDRRHVLPRDLLDAGDQFVDRLVDRHLFAHDAVHGLGPHVLIVENGEFEVLGEIERRGAARELGIDRLAMPVGLPEWALLSGCRHREPAAERAFDIGLQVF